MNVRPLLIAATLLFAAGALPAQDEPPRHEVGLTLGSVFGPARGNGVARVTPEAGIALQANYGYRLLGGRTVALYGETHFLASPQRTVRSNTDATRDFATLFVTPGLRVKLKPAARWSPYVVAGGGYGQFEQSTTLLSGAANPEPRRIHRGVFDFGGGVDARVWRFVAMRLEVRDFYSGSPLYHSAGVTGGQHNVVAGGGLVLRFQ